jgi:hypothetical protein
MTAVRTCVNEAPAEYVVELDVDDVDAARVRAVATPGGLEIHVPRSTPEEEVLGFLDAEAEPETPIGLGVN